MRIFDAIAAIAVSQYECDCLTDRIAIEESAISCIPPDYAKRRLYLDLDIIRRDIMLLSLGLQEAIELEGDNAKEIEGLKRTNRILENFILYYINEKKAVAAGPTTPE